MRYDEFQHYREQQLAAHPGLVDAAETNVYRALAPLRPADPAAPSTVDPDRTVYRCDLARTWLHRYGLPPEWSRRAMVSRGVRHGLALMFRQLHAEQAELWIPSDVYPVYGELARAAGLTPGGYPTLPAPGLPQAPPTGRPEYLLLTNPSKPLGRFLTDPECAELTAWLGESPHRRLLIDTVYDLGTPFAAGTRRLLETGRAVLLHSVTKGWLWPQTFGIVLLGPDQSGAAEAFRTDPPDQSRLRLAESLLGTHADTPQRIADALADRAERLFARLPAEVLAAIPAAARTSPGNYFFPVPLPAAALREQHGLLALPVTVFGANPWPGSVLTSLADTFGPTPAVPR
ncbi:aminotransferase class I/II-fold pyridoxal phosphate-dependent enzyme [Kitasatospora sp. NPDC088134]|uniref:aminotransferase class I/II-fold pyridoxal phosphate-dependent enzyme n=1 Tax=Kitasatospora sp. NPDC088134 TaxID=3364071 RepID=UPI003815155E